MVAFKRVLLGFFVFPMVMILLCPVSPYGSSMILPGREGNPQTTPPLIFQIAADKMAYKKDEAIILECEIKNRSHQTIYLAPIMMGSILLYGKYESEQQPAPLGPNILIFEIKEDLIKLPPNTSQFFQRLVKKPAYALPQQYGQYDFFAIYTNRTHSKDNMDLWVGEIKSNIIKIRITE